MTIAVALVVAAVLVHMTGSRRHDALRAVAARATAALAQARAANAGAFAPDELSAAETALREARTAQRIEEIRLWPVPNSARVGAAFGVAEQQARQALTRAREHRSAAVSAADAALAEAGTATTASAALAETIHLETQRRALLGLAQLALTEARVYRREGDYSSATMKAREATSLADQVRDHAATVAARYADAETVARWRRWRDETIAWSRREGRAAIIVSKEAHLLTLLVRGKPLKTYRADMGVNWIADKSQEGDAATPEGRYRVVGRQANGPYYKALLLDYPNAEDRAQFARARRRGNMPVSAGIGGLIEIHGEGGRGQDWTSGCVAVANADMDELFSRVEIGTPVTIVGSDDFGSIAGIAVRLRNGTAKR